MAFERRGDIFHGFRASRLIVLGKTQFVLAGGKVGLGSEEHPILILQEER